MADKSVAADDNRFIMNDGRPIRYGWQKSALEGRRPMCHQPSGAHTYRSPHNAEATLSQAFTIACALSRMRRAMGNSCAIRSVTAASAKPLDGYAVNAAKSTRQGKITLRVLFGPRDARIKRQHVWPNHGRAMTFTSTCRWTTCCTWICPKPSRQWPIQPASRRA